MVEIVSLIYHYDTIVAAAAVAGVGSQSLLLSVAVAMLAMMHQLLHALVGVVVAVDDADFDDKLWKEDYNVKCIKMNVFMNTECLFKYFCLFWVFSVLFMYKIFVL